MKYRKENKRTAEGESREAGRMKWKHMLRYSFQSVMKSGAYRILLLGVILSVALPVLFLTLTDSMLYTAREKKKDLYGAFTDLYYGSADASGIGQPDGELEKLLDSAEKEKITEQGSLYALDAAFWAEQGQAVEPSLEAVWEQRVGKSAGFLGIQKTEGLLAAGYADETARELGRIRLKEGAWPGEGQAAVTEGLRKELGDVSIGGRVSAGGREYEISGILYDYGTLYVSNTNQSELDRVIPEFLLSETDFRAMAEGSGSAAVSRRTMLRLSGVFSPDVYQADYRLVQNTPIRQDRFSVPPFMLVLVYLCQALLLAQLVMLGLPRMEKRMRIFRLLGAEAGKIPVFLYLDLGWILIFAIPAGLIAGIGGAYLVCLAGKGVTGAAFLFRVRGGETAGAVLLTAALFALSGIWPAIRLSRTGILEHQAAPFRRKRRILSGALLCLLMFGIFCLYGASRCYLRADERQNLSVPVYGKLETDYDYEFLASVVSEDTSYVDEDGTYVGLSVMEQDDIFTVYNEPYLGMGEEDLKALSDIEGVRKVSAYKTCTQVRMPYNRDSEYQSALSSLGVVKAGEYQETVAEIFGLEGAYVDAKLQGYPEEELESLASYVEEGRIDLEKIRSGEEVVLVVPDVQVETEEYDMGDGVMGTATTIHYLEKGAYSGAEGQYSDRAIHAGDEITLTRLYSENQGLRGFVKEHTVREEVRRQDLTVRVGAVIRCRAGWFEHSNTPDPYYSFLCLNETFDALGLSSTYTRVRVYSGAGADEAAVKQAVYRIKNQFPEMDLDDRYSFMEEYRQYHLLLTVLGALLSGLCAVIGAGMLTGRMLMRIREDRKRTGLYEIAGYTRKRLFGILIRPLIWQLLLMWAAAMAAVRALARRYYFLEDFWGMRESMLSLLAAAVLLALVILICAGEFFRESVSSLIREEE